ncbi:hypothetical protein K439DRAFT_1416175 [Ramaria rubella]|nr:hypothetical protein K439DRAFT_1416175 [Ramaria rubella]
MGTIMSDEEYFDESDVECDFDSDPEGCPSPLLRVDKGKQKIDDFVFQSFSPTELEEETRKEIESVMAILGLEFPIASILLRQFRWNKDRLLDAFMESPHEVSNLKCSGERLSGIGPPAKRQRVTPEEFICDICCESPPDSEVFQEGCGHKFCNSCWNAYIVGKVKDEGQCIVSCMQEGCQTILEDDTIRDLTDASCLERFRALVLESFVKVHSHFRFCPSPGCDQVVSCHGATQSAILNHVPTVACGNSHVFCFGCGLDIDHRPVICAIAGMWLKNAKDDSGTSQWIQANTKNCPRCKNPTEKNGGCNRILCRECQFQWCWMCQQNWNVHGYTATCNAFKEKFITESLDVQAQAQANLEKWLFYYDRFTNHELSAKLDQELYEQTEYKMVEVQNSSGLSWIQARFMKDAVDELTKCRATLKWTYAMAFFIQKGNMKQMFEDVQADLEKAVEALSEMLEEDVSSETVLALRQRMVDKTVYVQKRNRIMLDDTSAGLQEGRWSWTVTVE